MLDLGLDLNVWPWVWLVGGGVVLVGVVRRYQSLVRQGTRLPPGVGGARLVGSTGVVTRAIDPDDATAHGQVRVAGETWFARAAGPDVLTEGARVRITEVEGTRLHVVPVDDDNPTTRTA